MSRIAIPLLIGLAIGAAIGVAIGWLAPLGDSGAEFADLDSNHKAEVAVMIGAAYAKDHNFDAAQSRLGLLAEPDPAAYVVLLTEQYIAEGKDPEEIRYLALLSEGFGYVTSPMLPYLTPSPIAP